MKWHIRILLVAALSFLSADTFAQRYVGSETCKGCHAFAYERWSQGPHAKAHRSLNQAQQVDAKCNTCHLQKDKRSKSETVSVKGIGCESCHGPGQYYHPAYVMRDSELAGAVGLIRPTGASCRTCHTEGTPSIRAFSFESFWKEIDHGKAARDIWEAGQVQE